LARQLAFWTGTLKDLPDQIELPVDRPRPAVASYRGDSIALHIGAELHGDLLKLARESRASLFMVLQAGLAALLTQLGAGTDIPIGSPIAGTHRQRARRSRRLLRQHAGAAHRHEPQSELPRSGRARARRQSGGLQPSGPAVERLVEVLNPARSLSRHPLFQVMLGFENDVDARLELRD